MQDNAILWLSLILFVGFLILLPFAWVAAYRNHPTLTIWGTQKKS